MNNIQIFSAFFFIVIVLLVIIPLMSYLITKMICDAKTKAKMELLKKLKPFQGDTHGKEEFDER